jgi:hypothetical protein
MPNASPSPFQTISELPSATVLEKNLSVMSRPAAWPAEGHKP